ncbi:MAG TPA: FAD-dependent oxidoreductase [Patescibacteria group bacterium]|nr:FAD-dependent oxidoreductase [Patescibacteria group bacterium]
MHKVLIVGGGFGGVKAALELADNSQFHITLLSDHLDFRYYPSLYRTATGGKKLASSIPLKEIFKGKDVHLVEDKATKLDRQKHTIFTAKHEIIEYDALILALGVRTNYFHIEGLEEFSYGIKTNAEATRLKQHLHQQLIDEHKPDLNYVVIGGGPTGVELAGALPAYLRQIAKKHGVRHRAIRVELVEAMPRLVPRMPTDIGKTTARHLRRLGVRVYLNTSVKAETAEALTLNNKKLASHSVIWTAGVANQPFLADNVFQMTKNGKVRVNQFLEAEPSIYVIGDNADTPYSGLAQTALYDGAYVAGNLKRLANKQDAKPYVAKKPIYVIPAGPHWAAVLWGNLRMYGRLGSSLRRLADLVAYHDYEPWQLATKHWAAEEDSEESCPICAQTL